MPSNMRKLNGSLAVKRPKGAIRPNLFIIGAMKCGTTYLAELLSEHPSVFMCQPKEPCYFVDPEELRRLWPWAWKRGYWRSEGAYLGLFQSAGAATVIGEASVYYTHLPVASDIPEKIRQFNPDARFVYVMRDPVLRTISHYWHRVRWHDEGRTLLSAIQNDPQYSDVSNYAMQLAPYVQLFGRDRVKILTLEKLIGNPAKAIGSIHRWLRVEPLSTLGVPPANVTPEAITRPVWNGILHRIRHRTFLCAAIDLVPASIRGRVAKTLRRTVKRSDVDTKEAMHYLRSSQLKRTEELTKLIGRSFPEWTTLYGSIWTSEVNRLRVAVG